jgi:hypothetical protein
MPACRCPSARPRAPVGISARACGHKPCAAVVDCVFTAHYGTAWRSDAGCLVSLMGEDQGRAPQPGGCGFVVYDESLGPSSVLSLPRCLLPTCPLRTNRTMSRHDTVRTEHTNCKLQLYRRSCILVFQCLGACTRSSAYLPRHALLCRTQCGALSKNSALSFLLRTLFRASL